VLGVTIKTTAETIYQANDRFGSESATQGARCECPILLKADVQWVGENDRESPLAVIPDAFAVRVLVVHH